MNYRKYGKTGFETSLLGFGVMRLPRIYHGEDKPAEVDREKSYELLRYAAEHGVNYFDTAFTYHHQDSENVLGEALEGELRKKVKIATKQPIGVMKTTENIRRNLESTLKKLRTDYIDVYLMHNIQGSTWAEFQRLGALEEYQKFREEGLIRNIGFSYHGGYEDFVKILDAYDWDMCQLQQNLLDVDNEATSEGIRYAGRKGCAVVIMEPLRGGGLVNTPPEVRELYMGYDKQRSNAEWAFRHLIDFPEVSVVLSGMTTMEQLKENIEIFSKKDAVPGCLSTEEKEILAKAKTIYEKKAAVPCTGCEYCLPCPKGVNIPDVFSTYNEGVMFDAFDQPKRSYMFIQRAGGDASKCVQCRLCEQKCPQHIEISEQLKVADAALKGWIE